jgi:hypothetical protein
VYTANLHRCPATLVTMEALEKAMRTSWVVKILHIC